VPSNRFYSSTIYYKKHNFGDTDVLPKTKYTIPQLMIKTYTTQQNYFDSVKIILLPVMLPVMK